MELVHKAKTEDMLVRMQEFLEVVCYDVVTNFLMQMTHQAGAAVSALEYAQLDNTVIDKFTGQLSEVRRFITDAKFASFKRLQAIIQYKKD